MIGILHLDESTMIDLLFASSGIESEMVKAAEDFEITPNFKVPIARVGHLIALKVLSKNEETRPQDVDLLLVADETERNRAREAVKLIIQRGYNRGKIWRVNSSTSVTFMLSRARLAYLGYLVF
jgi:hypothetical protein